MFFNLPNQTPAPNDNNLTAEATKYIQLYNSLKRSNEGVETFESSSSGKRYSTDDYISDRDVYNKGQTGLMNLLYKYVLKQYIVSSDELNRVFLPREFYLSVPSTGWTKQPEGYVQSVSVRGMVADGASFYDLQEYQSNEAKEFAKVTKLEALSGSVLLTAQKSQPNVDLNIRVTVLGSTT